MNELLSSYINICERIDIGIKTPHGMLEAAFVHILSMNVITYTTTFTQMIVSVLLTQCVYRDWFESSSLGAFHSHSNT